MKKQLLISIVLFTCSAFGQKDIISASNWKKGDLFPEEISGFHKKSGIKWWLMNDSVNIYIKFETYNHNLQRVLMKDGFTFYFDTIKQKNKEDFLSYTNKAEKPDQLKNTDQKINDHFDMSIFSPIRDENIRKQYNKAIWNMMPFDLDIERTGLSAYFIFDTLNALCCYAVIPFKIINKAGLNSINKLSLCLKIESKEQIMNPSENMRPGMKQDPLSGAFQNGNRPQGGSKPPKMGNSPKIGDMGSPPGASFSIKTVKFWFLVNLSYCDTQ